MVRELKWGGHGPPNDYAPGAAANVFFNNKRKLSTDSPVTDGVKVLKKRERKVNLSFFLP